MEQESRLARIQAWLRRRLAVVLVLGVVVIAFGFAWPFDPEGPLAIGWLAFMIRTFSFHGGLVLLGVAVLGALARSPVVSVGAMPLVAFVMWPALPMHSAATTDDALRVMSINLLESNDEYQRVLDQIAREDPDVVLLQEYGVTWDEAISEDLHGMFEHAIVLPRRDAFGAAVYSKIEFVEAAWFSLAETPQARVVVEYDGAPVTLYSVHLLPPAGLSITREAWRQFAELERRVSQESGAVIVAGDFNFTPRSGQAGRLRRLGLTEAHAGRGRGATWPEDGIEALAPGVRLDQAYISDALTLLDSRVLERNGSDHRPIVIDVER